MGRHPHYLEIPWEIHWHCVTKGPHRHSRWLMALLVLFVMFLIGVGITNGII